MLILVDSREQKPLIFKKSITVCLKFGDYCASFGDFHHHPVVFERKSLNDLFGTLGAGYTRFRKEITRAKESNYKLIIAIEATKDEVRKGIKHSKRDGTSVIIQLNTIKKKYEIDHIYFESRKEMTTYILNYYQQEYESWKKK